MKKIIIIAFIFILSGSFKAFAIDEIQQGATLSVQDCVEIGIKNNPQINPIRKVSKLYDSPN